MTLKPDPSKASSPQSVKVWVDSSEGWNGRTQSVRNRIRHPVDRLCTRVTLLKLFALRYWRRLWLVWLIGWLLGLFTALLPILFSQISSQIERANSRAFHEPIAQLEYQMAQWLDPTQPADVPNAVSGLTQFPLWSHAATLAAQYGHLPYDPANADQLVPTSSQQLPSVYSGEYLRPDAGVALKRMIDAARTDGVWLVLVSGFRDLSTQGALFQSRSQQYGSEEAAAKSVAPPGYSEHHTGYAVDLTDGSGQDFRSFAETKAFQWMMIHAHEFEFELSFPQNNPQGVDYEPWHWRFVGSDEAAQTFAAAKRG